MSALPSRAEVDKRFTWDGESVFPDEAGWEAAASVPGKRASVIPTR